MLILVIITVFLFSLTCAFLLWACVCLAASVDSPTRNEKEPISVYDNLYH